MTEQNPEDQQVNVNPAWQDILDALPNDLHPLITPKLEQWDKSVQDKLQDIRSQYDPYEPIVKNKIPLDDIQGALYLAQAFQENPEDVVKRAIEEFGLGYIPKDQVPSPATPSNDDYDEDDMTELAGLENHPAFKALMEKVEQANGILTTQQQREKEEQEAAELETYLETLHNDHGDFNDLYVNALMANGVTAENAIQMYKDTIAEEVQKAVGTTQQQTTTPPVVLGGDGHTGTGIPADPVQMGALSKGNLNDVVLQFLQQNDTNKA